MFFSCFTSEGIDGLDYFLPGLGEFTIFVLGRFDIIYLISNESLSRCCGGYTSFSLAVKSFLLGMLLTVFFLKFAIWISISLAAGVTFVGGVFLTTTFYSTGFNFILKLSPPPAPERRFFTLSCISYEL